MQYCLECTGFFPINIHDIKHQQIRYAETAIHELIQINGTVDMKTAQI